MIELRSNQLIFRFPEVHKEAECSIEFQRTLRIPDDNRDYPLPPGLGRFPVQHVDDFANTLPAIWQTHGGVFLPMFQSEALWINFSGHYPCAVKIAAGKINAVTGEPWNNKLSKSPQDYAVIPKQPWIDGFNVSDDYIRQFVAMPLGDGFTAEEQITGKAEHGGLQIIVYPMKHDAYVEHVKQAKPVASALFSLKEKIFEVQDCASPDMGLAPGGLMRQEIYDDEYGIDAWDQNNGYRCFVHLANSRQYQAITGQQPPNTPPTAKDYTKAGLPWFDYYSDGSPVAGSDTLGKLSSVGAKTIELGKGALPDNDPVKPALVKKIGSSFEVRDGDF